MGFIDVGAQARLDRCIGYYEPYATSHDALDGHALTGMNWRRTNFAMACARWRRPWLNYLLAAPSGTAKTVTSAVTVEAKRRASSLFGVHSDGDTICASLRSVLSRLSHSARR